MGDIPYQTIFAISESPIKYGVIYAGTDDGRAHVTKDEGKTWTEITSGLIEDRWIYPGLLLLNMIWVQFI